MELTFWQKHFPHRALRRELARAQIKRLKERYYKSGEASPYRPVGPQSDVSPQALTQAGSEQMRAYARNLDENHSLSIGILDGLVNNIIGPSGVPVMPMMKNRDGSLNVQANEQMARILKEWARKPTADRQYSFGQAQRLLCRSWLRDGEVLIQRLAGNISGFEHAGGVPYTLELLESDYLPFMLNESDPRLIVQGIEMTRFYQPIAYYLSKQHPGDVFNAYIGTLTSESDYRRIDADQIMHLKFTRRLNQARGVSLLHGVITDLEDLDEYASSERIASRVAAAFTGYIKKSPDAQTVVNPDTGNRDLEMSPGMIFDNLLPGEEVGSIQSNRPNTAINEFQAGQMRNIAAGTMSSYSTISRDYDGSYSSQRQAMVEVKPNYDTLRDYFQNQFITPVYRDLVDMAMASRALVIPRTVDPETIHDIAVARVAMAYVDPKKEVEADILRVDNNLASTSQVITERGGDPLQVAKQIETDQDLFPEREMPDELDTGTGNESAEDETAENAEAAEAEG